MTIAVAGATGALGTLVIEALLRRVPADQIVAWARDTSKAAPLTAKGITVREVDYNRPETLRPALEGVHRLLLISGNDLANRITQHRAVVDASATYGELDRLIYTSILGADTTTNPVAADHVTTEQYLAASGVPWTAARNGWYNENYLTALDTAEQSGHILTSIGQGRVASASRADYAEAAAILLTTPADELREVYELSGDTAWTQEDLAAISSELLGAPIELKNVTASEHAKALTEAGLPSEVAELLTAIAAAEAKDELALGAGELGALIGRPTTPLRDTLRAVRPTKS